MAQTVVSTLSANILSTEQATGNVVINRGTGNPNVTSTTALYVEQFITGAAGIDTIIPSPTVSDMLYIRNLDAAAIITVKATPQGGVEAIIGNLQPGSQLILWNTLTGKGWTNVKVASSVGTTGVEIFSGTI